MLGTEPKLWVEFEQCANKGVQMIVIGTHQEVNRLLSLVDILISHTFVHLQPGHVALRVLVLQAEVPGLAKADRSTDEVEKLLTGGLPTKAELQFGVHRRDLDGK